MSLNTQTKPVGYLQLVRGNANFRNLWFGQIISLLGDWFNLIASSALVAALTDSGLAIGGLFVVRMLAQFFASPVGGVMADRYDRKKLLVLADLIRAVVVLGFFLVRNPKDVWLLYTLTAVQLALGGIFNPTRNSLLPDVVSREELGPANALSSATWSTMLAFGAALGGLVAGEWGLKPAFAIDSFTFILSAYFILQVRHEHQPKVSEDGGEALSAFLEYVDGLRYLRAHLNIFLLAVQKSAVALAVSSIFPIIQVSLATKMYVIGEGGSTSLGMFYGVVGVGTGIGPILARYFTGDDERKLRIAIMIGFWVAAVGLLTVSTLESFGIALLGTLLRGVGVGTVWVFSTQLLLIKVPNHVRGRIFGTEFAMFTLMNAIGASFGGGLIDHPDIGITIVLQGMAVLTFIFGFVWVALGGLRLAPEFVIVGVKDGL